MNTLSPKGLIQTIQHFRHVADYLTTPKNEAENQKLIELTRQLRTRLKTHKDPVAVKLLDLVLEQIELFEKAAYPIKPSSPAEILAFLMEQHNLTQSDLPELGTQPHVSKILNGKRQLTRDQISALSKRFHVSPAVFYD